MKLTPATLAAGFLTGLVALTTGPANAGDDMTKDRVRGDPDAPVTIIEYSSLTCPHCASFHTNIMPELHETYIETGQVNMIYRDFPLDGVALRASMMARCVSESRYFPVLEMLYERQERWAHADDPVAELERIGRLSGLSTEEFEACLTDEDLADAIIEMRMEAESEYGVEATPTFIIDGERYSGALPMARFEEILEPLLPDS